MNLVFCACICVCEDLRNFGNGKLNRRVFFCVMLGLFCLSSWIKITIGFLFGDVKDYVLLRFFDKCVTLNCVLLKLQK